MLTGRKLVTEYLSSMCLSKGEVKAILALSGNMPFLKLLLIAMPNGLLKTFADNFVSFDGILSIPVDFLISIFLFFSIFTTDNLYRKIKLTSAWYFKNTRGPSRKNKN